MGDCRLACWFACGYAIVLLWVSGLRSAADSFGVWGRTGYRVQVFLC